MANDIQERIDLLEQQIDDLNNFLDELNNTPSQVVSDRLLKVNKFLNNGNLNDDIKELLEQIKFIYENEPESWITKRKEQIQNNISQIQSEITELENQLS